MQRTIKYLYCTGLLALAAVSLPGADDAEGVRLRETLKATLLQLRNAQTDLANAQAAQTTLADEKKALTEQIALLKKHSVDDEAVAEKKITDQKTKISEQSETIARLNQAVEELRAASEKATAEGKTAEEKRVQLYKQNIVFERQVADLRAKNVALYRLGKDILSRYEKVGLGQQFMAREPFVGRTRVALENLIQDYDDKLAEQRAGNP